MASGTLDPNKLRNFNILQKTNLEESECHLSLIIVHGFRSSKTQQQHQRITQWARQIHHEIPHCDIYDYAFDLDELLMKGEKRIFDLSRQLLLDSGRLVRGTEIGEWTTDTTNRGHIVFVSHSVAFCVVQDTLWRALRDRRYLAFATAAFFFFRAEYFENDSDFKDWKAEVLKIFQRRSDPKLEFSTVQSIAVAFDRETRSSGAEKDNNAWLFPCFTNYRKTSIDMDDKVTKERLAERLERRSTDVTKTDVNPQRRQNISNTLRSQREWAEIGLDVPHEKDDETLSLVRTLNIANRSSPTRTRTDPIEDIKWTRIQRMDSHTLYRRSSVLSGGLSRRNLLARSPLPRNTKRVVGLIDHTEPVVLSASPKNLSAPSLTSSNAHTDDLSQPDLPQAEFKAPSGSNLRTTSNMDDTAINSSGVHDDQIGEQTPRNDMQTETMDFASALAGATSNLNEHDRSDLMQPAQSSILRPNSQTSHGDSDAQREKTRSVRQRRRNRWQEMAPRLLANANFDLAYALYTSLAKKEYSLQHHNEESMRAYVLLLQIEYHCGNFDECARGLDRISGQIESIVSDSRKQLKVKEIVARYWGLSELRLGQPRIAVTILEKISEPSNPARAALSDAYAQLGNVTKAIQFAKKIALGSTESVPETTPDELPDPVRGKRRVPKLMKPLLQNKEVADTDKSNQSWSVLDLVSDMQPKAFQLESLAILSTLGRYQEAIRIREQCFPRPEELATSKHFFLISEYAALGPLLLNHEGKTQLAEQEIQKTIRQMCDTRDLGPKHPSTLHAMQALVSIFHYQGRYSEAEYTSRYVMEEFANNGNMGKAHPEFLRTTALLANVLLAAGRWNDAHSELMKVSAAWKDAGVKVINPEILELQSVYSSVLLARGLSINAKAAAKRTLFAQFGLFMRHRDVRSNNEAIVTRMENLEDLGIDHVLDGSDSHIRITETESLLEWEVEYHPTVMDTMYCLARCYQEEEDQNTEFVRMLLHVVYSARKLQLGENNVATMKALVEYARILNDSGQVYEDPLRDLEKAMRFFEGVLGADHPETLWARHQHASACLAQGHFQQAMKEFCDVLNLRDRILGETHPDTVSSRMDLARSYVAVGNSKDAVDLFEVATMQSARLYPDQVGSRLTIPRLIQAKVAQAQALSEQEHHISAGAVQREVVMSYAGRFGEADIRTLSARNDLAQITLAAGDRARAKSEYETLFEKIKERTNEPLYLSILSNLAAIDFLEGNWKEAETRQETVQQAVQVRLDNHDRPTELDVVYYFNLALTKKSLARKDAAKFEEARETLIEAMDLARKIKGQPRLKELNRTLSHWLQEQWAK